MNSAVIRTAYDAEVRRPGEPDEPGATAELVTGPAGGRVARTVAPAGAGTSMVTWSDLDDASAGPAIAAQLRYFRARGEPFEWKLHDYDHPPDLGARLAAAGLAAGEEEVVMVAEAALVARAEPALPDGVRLAEVTGEAGLAQLIAVKEQAFGRGQDRVAQSLRAALATAPDTVAMVLALAGDEPVSAARAEFRPGRQFTGLWGGGTLPAWRGQGLYRALTAFRARLAVGRGYRYLQVDALPTSQPILARLGFTALARTTPYTWEPTAPEAAPPGAGGEGAMWSS
jgi:hypothetical protein